MLSTTDLCVSVNVSIVKMHQQTSNEKLNYLITLCVWERAERVVHKLRNRVSMRAHEKEREKKSTLTFIEWNGTHKSNQAILQRNQLSNSIEIPWANKSVQLFTSFWARIKSMNHTQTNRNWIGQDVVSFPRGRSVCCHQNPLVSLSLEKKWAACSWNLQWHS